MNCDGDKKDDKGTCAIRVNHRTAALGMKRYKDERGTYHPTRTAQAFVTPKERQKSNAFSSFIVMTF